MVSRVEICNKSHHEESLIGNNGFFSQNPWGVERAKATVEALWQGAQSSAQTERGRTVMMLEILPANLRIPQEVVRLDDKERLRKTIERFVKEGREVGLRACFLGNKVPGPGAAPWIMGLRSPELVKAFFGEGPIPKHPIWRGSPKTFNDWQEQYPTLSEIIVVGNPPGLGRENLKKKHFVFRVESFGDKLRIELRLGTDQLRDIDETTSRSRLIEVTMGIPRMAPEASSQGLIRVAPGRSYLKDIPQERFYETVGEEGFIWPEEAKPVLKPSAFKTTEGVIEAIFERRYPDFYYTLTALRNFGLGAIEFQGRRDQGGNVKWILAYGLRGPKEEKIPYVPQKTTGD